MKTDFSYAQVVEVGKWCLGKWRLGKWRVESLLFGI